MKNHLTGFRRLVIRHNRYLRKYNRLQLQGKNARKQAWLFRKLQALREKIEWYLTRADLVKKAALVSAGMWMVTAGVEAQSYEVRTDHPLYGVIGNGDAQPTFADFDADGDQDLFVFGLETGSESSLRDNSVAYYENTGSGFQKSIPAALPTDLGILEIADTTLLAKISGSFADFDGDADLDLFLGIEVGVIRYLRNDDGVYNPVVGAEDPFNAVMFESDDDVQPALGDIDGDGDVDAIVGGDDNLRLFINDGGAFTEMDEIPVQGTSELLTPALFDLDEDGDLDLLVGNKYGDLFYYVNDGGAFTQTDNALTAIELENYSISTLADVDGDGDSDLVVGERSGLLEVYANNEGNYEKLAFNTLGIDAEGDGSPALEFVDYDGDGDMDLFAGTESGALVYFENQDGAFVKTELSEFAGLDLELLDAVPSFGDYDNDGDLDLVVGSYDEPMLLYQNDGGSYGLVDTLSNPFFRLSDEDGQAPELVDVDGDGDLDLLIGNKYGTLEYFVNNEGVYEAAEENPFADIEVPAYAKPVFVDFDSDGDMDLILGTSYSYGPIEVYLNNEGVYEEVAEEDNPFTSFNFFDESSPAFSDLDGDGDLDVLVGSFNGVITYLENVDGSVSVDDRSDQSLQTSIYPNPVQDELQIQADWSKGSAEVEIIDLNGSVVLRQIVQGTRSVMDLSDLAPGAYMLRMGDDQNRAVKPLIKQ